ncbi:MAG TPA: deoxyribose-phosphate aldolase [Candidatus Avanaerovorax faecigallinarum]|nr:deoxyribose-phosphate aldolase [Candidatus Avanaerovorax faecigallinarum]
MKPLNKYFDHTLLKAEAKPVDIEKLCAEAKEYDFYSVCVNSCYVEEAAKLLKDTDVKIAAVVGFPLGACTTETKAFETEEACRGGASEVDMVLNVGMLKAGRDSYVEEDIRAVVRAAGKYNAIVKVILETCLLTDEEVVKACNLSKTAGAHFVKTSTGFSSGGATVHHVSLMKKTVGETLQVKASGGIRDYETARAMIDAGADRIGASATVAIMEEAE